MFGISFPLQAGGDGKWLFLEQVFPLAAAGKCSGDTGSTESPDTAKSLALDEQREESISVSPTAQPALVPALGCC